MTTHAANATSANFGFSAFLFSILSLALAEALNVKANAGLRQHVLTASVALLVSAVALRRCRLAWPGLANRKGRALGHDARWNLLDAAACLLLALMGSALARLTSTGSVTLFGIGAICISLTPWSRIAFCRNHFFRSCATVLISGACGLLFAGRPSDPVFLVLATWILSVIACATVLFAAFAKVTVGSDTPRQLEAGTSPELSLQGSRSE